MLFTLAVLAIGYVVIDAAVSIHIVRRLGVAETRRRVRALFE
jgi:hypothetical protein